jgi:superfamily II DNA or RNA helicase
MPDCLQRRKWGQRALDAAIDCHEREQKLLLINAFCGSGKTLTLMDICNELFRRGEIDKVLVFSPRVNLCQQYENSWKQFRTQFDGKVLGQVCYRTNDPPLIQPCMFDGTQDGVAQTYSSLASAPKLYLDFCRSYRVALVADEAQILGSSFEPDTDVTRAAELIRKLHGLSRFTILATGTPDRSDGNPLLLCADRYGPPDKKGIRPLLADVEATYLEGVSEQYLRPIEVNLVDGKALREFIDNGQQQDLILSGMSSGMSAIMVQPDFWQPMVEKSVEEIRGVRMLDPRYCGLIGACNRRHARAMAAYCRKRHGDLGCLLAISDEPDAQNNLRLFKKGRHGILITVGMAYVGYDHGWITVVLNLGAYRNIGWLDQFAFRGGRVLTERPLQEQTLKIIGPDDKLFRKWALLRRADSQLGLRIRTTRPPTGGDGGKERPNIILDVNTTGSSAIGMDPTCDLDAKRFEALHRLRQEYNLGPVNLTSLDALLRAQGIDPMKGSPESSVKPNPAPVDPLVTDEDRKRAIRAELREITNKIDGMIRARFPSIENGWAYQQINLHFNCKIGDHGIGSAKLKEALEWAINVLKPQVLTWKQQTSA